MFISMLRKWLIYVYYYKHKVYTCTLQLSSATAVPDKTLLPGSLTHCVLLLQDIKRPQLGVRVMKCLIREVDFHITLCFHRILLCVTPGMIYELKTTVAIQQLMYFYICNRMTPPYYTKWSCIKHIACSYPMSHSIKVNKDQFSTRKLYQETPSPNLVCLILWLYRKFNLFGSKFVISLSLW